MKIYFKRVIRAVLCVCAGWAAMARGDDLTTLTGQTYSNIVVQQYDRQGLIVLHDGGTDQIPFKNILPELRGHYKALSLIPISLAKKAGEKEEPAGPNDLATLSGQIYRNVVLKQVGEDRILIAHDSGMDTVYFSAIPASLQEKYRSGIPVVPDPAASAKDIVTTYGQVFRNVEIRLVEPDGLTFHHDGGVTKLGFPALGDELQQKHGYDPVVAWKYQREMAAKRLPVQMDAPLDPPVGPATFTVYAIETAKLPDNKFWVRFSVRNLTDQPQSVQAVPCTEKLIALIAAKTIDIPALSEVDLKQVQVPDVAPSYLKISCGGYYTNCALSWQ